MIEVLWHGRGGQGAFTAARLLGAAASLSGRGHALAFPSFGPERRGAPMRAFTKLSDTPIGDRSAVDAADFVVYLDDTLFDYEDEAARAAGRQPAWTQELKAGGRVLVNSAAHFADPRVMAIDANGLSERILGRPIPNTVFLGALAALGCGVSKEDVLEAIRQYMPAKLHAKNIAIVEESFGWVVERCQDERADGAAASPSEAPASGAAQDSNLGVSRETREGAGVAGGLGGAQPSRPEGTLIPRLRDGASPTAPSLDPAAFARTTCFQAGHLVSENAGWRNIRPLISPDACTGCLQCYLYCPDGAIYKTGATKDQLASEHPGFAAVAVDYGFCKGCGICAKACRFEAIAMIPEQEALAAEAMADIQGAVGWEAAQGSDETVVEGGLPIDGSQAAAGEGLAAAFLADFERESAQAPSSESEVDAR